MRYIYLSAAVAFLIIGIHQLMTVGLLASYFFFMLAFGLVILTRLSIVNTNKKASGVSQKPNLKRPKPKKK